MSKYKVGDKFILEVGESYGAKMPLGAETDSPMTLYKAKGFNSLVFDDNELDKLHKYDEVKERLELIDELKQEQYNRGLQDAWELMRKITTCNYRKGGLDSNELLVIFGTANLFHIIKNFTPQEALAKIEAYEKEQEQIKVGDVVEVMGNYCIITSIDKDDKEYDVLWSSGVADSVPFDAPFSFKKTGKHLDIASILAEIGKE